MKDNLLAENTEAYAMFEKLIAEMSFLAQKAKNQGFSFEKVVPHFVFSLAEGWDCMLLIKRLVDNLNKLSGKLSFVTGEPLKVNIHDVHLSNPIAAERHLAESIINATFSRNSYSGICVVNLAESQTEDYPGGLTRIVEFAREMSPSVKFVFMVPFLGEEEVRACYCEVFEMLTARLLRMEMPQLHECLSLLKAQLLLQDMTLSSEAERVLEDFFSTISSRSGFRGVATVDKLAADLGYHHLALGCEKEISAKAVKRYITSNYSGHSFERKRQKKVGFGV